MNMYGALVEGTKENLSTEEKFEAVPLCPPQIPHKVVKVEVKQSHYMP
jgi:hypothetical protein